MVKKAEKPKKTVKKKAAPKKTAAKRRPTAKTPKRPVDPVIVQLVVIDPPKGLRQITEPIGSPKVTSVSIVGKANGKALLALLSDPTSGIWSVPVNLDEVRPSVDTALLTDEVLELLLPLMTPSKYPGRDKGFLENCVTKVSVLVNNTDDEAPAGIKSLKVSVTDKMPVLTVSSFCALMADDEALRWIRRKTHIPFGPRTQEVLKELSMLLQAYFGPTSIEG